MQVSSAAVDFTPLSADHANTERHDAHARTASLQYRPVQGCFTTRHVSHDHVDEGVSATGCLSAILLSAASWRVHSKAPHRVYTLQLCTEGRR